MNVEKYYNDIQLSISKRVKERRIQLGISQEELARKTGYSDKSSISKIEKGQAIVPLVRLHLLKKNLHTSFAYLHGFTDDPEDNSKFVQVYDRFFLDGEPTVTVYEKAKKYIEEDGDALSEISFLDRVVERANEFRLLHDLNPERQKWSDNFKNYLKNYLDSGGETGSFVRGDLYEMAKGWHNLSFDGYCGLADFLHLSVDEMIGLNNIKVKENKQIKQFIELFNQLTPEQQNLITAQIKGILSSEQ